MYDASMHLDGIVNRVVIMIVLWKPDGQRQPTSERKKEFPQIQVVFVPASYRPFSKRQTSNEAKWISRQNELSHHTNCV